MLRAVKSFSQIHLQRKRKMGINSSTQKDHTLRTARGTLIGVEVSDARTNQPIYARYSRIRYALPPIGERRWRKPEPLPEDWIFSDGNNHPRDYRNFGAICPQLNVASTAAETAQWQEMICNIMDEDCLFLNIWVPLGVEKPAGGLPVQFDFPEGGFQGGHGLQHPFLDPIDLFREHRDCPRIIVSANYRVGIFGFLAGENLLEDSMDEESGLSTSAGNFGMWDLRRALEWTSEHIGLFGGNPKNITAGGFGPTTALQVHFDAFRPADQRIIRRAYLFSGAVSIQPDIAESAKSCKQFDEVCQTLMINRDLPGKDKVRLLRGVSSDKLLEVVRMLEPEFHPVTDGHGGFVPPWMLQSMWSGEFGRRLKQRNFQVIIGDSSDERCLYEHWSKNKHSASRIIASREGLIAKLRMIFPDDVCNALVKKYAVDITDWTSIYCNIMADVNVHAAVRGFAQCLLHGGMTTAEVLRYHIDWRPKGLDDWIHPGTGISHVMDVPIWYYGGWRAGFSKKDKHDVLVFAGQFARFLEGDTSARCSWGTEAEYEVRLLTADGSSIVTEDPLWVKKLDIWNVVRDVQRQRSASRTMSANGARCV